MEILILIKTKHKRGTYGSETHGMEFALVLEAGSLGLSKILHSQGEAFASGEGAGLVGDFV